MSRHANLISSLTEFYTLLIQLAVVDHSLLVIPDVAAIAQFPREAALGAGFHPEAVDLIAKLPYLAVGTNPTYPEIKSSTFLVDYYTDRENEGDFEALRSMDDDPANDDNLIPGHSIRLTQQNIYGYSLIYNTETSLMTEWKSFDEPVEMNGYAHLPARLPSEVLSSWIEPYRSLDVLITPLYTLWDKRYLTEVKPPIHYNKRERVIFQNTRELEMALWRIKDMYIECGWNVTSQEQDSFDRGKFVALQQEYMDNTIQPLESQHEKTMQQLEEQQVAIDERTESNKEEL